MNDNFENNRDNENKDNNEVFASDIAYEKETQLNHADNDNGTNPDKDIDNPDERAYGDGQSEAGGYDPYQVGQQANNSGSEGQTTVNPDSSADGQYYGGYNNGQNTNSGYGPNYGQSQYNAGGYYPNISGGQPAQPGGDYGSQGQYTGNTNNGGYTGYNGSNPGAGYGPYGQSQGDGGQNNAYNPYGQPSQQNQSDSYGGNVQYKWNYDDYQNALNNKGKPPKKNKGLKAFVIAVCSVFAVSVVSLAGYGVSTMFKNGNFHGIGGIVGNSSSSSSVTSKGETLKTNDKPTTSSSSSSNGISAQMSAEQVYNSLKNSVVTIEVYDNTQSVNPVSEGSGIISSKDGYIITNEHVIDGAASIDVVLSDNKQYPATVVGKDTRTDLAVLKINASGLTPATFGNSDQTNVAETVLAIGNPGGLEFSGSVTQGIVSAVNRIITTQSGTTATVIQTDAPINPGNSGGALVNMYGQVIGITSSKIESTGYEGMGFAIPINSAKPIVDSLIQNGYVTGRVKIGISVVEYDTARAAQFGYPAGLLIQAIDSSSNAATKGLKAGDFITKIDGTAITSYNQFYTIESKHKPGEDVVLTIFRSSTNSTFDVSVTLAEDKGN